MCPIECQMTQSSMKAQEVRRCIEQTSTHAQMQCRNSTFVCAVFTILQTPCMGSMQTISEWRLNPRILHEPPLNCHTHF